MKPKSFDPRGCAICGIDIAIGMGGLCVRHMEDWMNWARANPYEGHENEFDGVLDWYGDWLAKQIPKMPCANCDAPTVDDYLCLSCREAMGMPEAYYQHGS